jgi:hypothetical protein
MGVLGPTRQRRFVGGDRRELVTTISSSLGLLSPSLAAATSSTMMSRVNKFGEFYQNSLDSVPTEF